MHASKEGKIPWDRLTSHRYEAMKKTSSDKFAYFKQPKTQNNLFMQDTKINIFRAPIAC